MRSLLAFGFAIFGLVNALNNDPWSAMFAFASSYVLISWNDKRRDPPDDDDIRKRWRRDHRKRMWWT